MQRHAAWLQVLVIQIWSEQDLSSLHTLEVREDDFQALKQEQGILVDFRGFPAKIITLLQRCLASCREDPPRCGNLLSSTAYHHAYFTLGGIPAGPSPNLRCSMRPQ